MAKRSYVATSEDSEAVKFYDLKERFGSFSNLSEYGIQMAMSPTCLYYHRSAGASKCFKTVEHFYQWTKFHYHGASKESIEYAELIANASTPNKARVLALQSPKGGYPWRTALNEPIRQSLAAGVTIRSDWDQVKRQIMYEGIRAKFQQHDSLHQLLLSTGTKHIMEDSPRDSYWGIGRDGHGENHLGKLLMQLREELRDEIDAEIAVAAPVIDLTHDEEYKSKYQRKIISKGSTNHSTSRCESVDDNRMKMLLHCAAQASDAAPTHTCNWLLSPNDRLLTGSYPGDIDPARHQLLLEKIVLESKVTIFISLMEPQEQVKFNSYHSIVEQLVSNIKLCSNGEEDSSAQSSSRQEISFHNFPMKDRKAASTENLFRVLEFIDHSLASDPSAVVYLHCHGGHGRTGLVAALWLARKLHLSSAQALQIWYTAHDTRKRKTIEKLARLTRAQLTKLEELNNYWMNDDN